MSKKCAVLLCCGCRGCICSRNRECPSDILILLRWGPWSKPETPTQRFHVILCVNGCYGVEVDHVQAVGSNFVWCSDVSFDSRLEEYCVGMWWLSWSWTELLSIFMVIFGWKGCLIIQIRDLMAFTTRCMGRWPNYFSRCDLFLNLFSAKC